MLIPGNRILLFALLILLDFVFCFGEGRHFSPFSSGVPILTMHTTSLSKIRARPGPGLLRVFGKFCFLKSTVISYTKQENIGPLGLTSAKNTMASPHPWGAAVTGPTQPWPLTDVAWCHPACSARPVRPTWFPEHTPSLCALAFLLSPWICEDLPGKESLTNRILHNCFLSLNEAVQAWGWGNGPLNPYWTVLWPSKLPTLSSTATAENELCWDTSLNLMKALLAKLITNQKVLASNTFEKSTAAEFSKCTIIWHNHWSNKKQFQFGIFTGYSRIKFC